MEQLSPYSEKQHYSQRDYNEAINGFVAKVENIQYSQTLYLRPSREYPVGSFQNTSIQIKGSDALILLLICDEIGDIYISPMSSTSVLLNQKVVTQKTQIKNYDEFTCVGLTFRIVMFYEDISFETYTEATPSVFFSILKEKYPVLVNTTIHEPPMYLSDIRHPDSINISEITEKLNTLRSNVKYSDNNQLYCALILSLCYCFGVLNSEMSLNIIEDDVTRYVLQKGFIRSPSEKIDFESMANEEDPFEAFRKSTISGIGK
ncbi:FHA domain-containing protein [Entamoeba marina]